MDTLGQNKKKIILWGHNTHIGRNIYGKTDSGTMGHYLEQKYGNLYFPIGSSFYYGEFNAIPLTTEHKSDVPPPDSYESFFDSVNFPIFYIQLDIDSIPNWFSEIHCMRNIGASYDDMTPSNAWDVDELSNEFDGFIFVKKSTPTHLLGW